MPTPEVKAWIRARRGADVKVCWRLITASVALDIQDSDSLGLPLKRLVRGETTELYFSMNRW